jgi:hypothetical protein
MLPSARLQHDIAQALSAVGDVIETRAMRQRHIGFGAGTVRGPP